MLPYQFEWPVDQAGYDLRVNTDGPAPELYIEARGGPPRFYRPMSEHPTLWLRCATQCIDGAGALAFVDKFGLLSAEPPLSAWERLMSGPISGTLRGRPRPDNLDELGVILDRAAYLRE